MFERLKKLSELIKNCEFSKKNENINSEEALRIAHFFLKKTFKEKGIVYVIGNGGSAGIASHFSTDLMKTLKIPSFTLVDSNLMTCISNDYGYENVYSTPLKMVLKKEDLLFAISSSGKSENIVKAAVVAREKEVGVVTLSGFSKENPLKKLGDLNFFIDKKDYGLVEMAHFFLLHTIVDLWKTSSLMQETFQKLHEKNKNLSRN